VASGITIPAIAGVPLVRTLIVEVGAVVVVVVGDTRGAVRVMLDVGHVPAVATVTATMFAVVESGH
jgi:hypothetical protein